ncbi:YIP1 family protein [Haloplanus halophilus]|uniref:YIP1 family protein n=1 Tax=Haloplanus halophilus TaxID=2949993 RepID=UPI00203FE857|nr:YIP1 family protein [Haloplanus sp. GDY1]
MTTWVENPRGGRDRGPRGVARAWVEVVVRPRRFFSHGVAPGDQAPGLVFAVVTAVAYALGLALLDPARFPATGALRAAVVVLLVALLVAPAVLHLLAALQTLALMATVRDRAGVSETVQVIAYATAPAPLAAVPVLELRVAACLYGAALLVVGLAVVHDTTVGRATLAGALPAALLFGYGFGGFGALAALLRAWYII